MNEPQPPTAGPSGDEPRPVNLAAVAGGVILIALVAFALYRRHAVAPADGASPAVVTEEVTDQPLTGTPIGAVVPVSLSPEAAVIAERYRCVCGCKDPLAVCTCNQTPGSNDMKLYVKELVEQRKTPSEIDAAMVERYGRDVLLASGSGPAAAVKR